jgi:phage gp29-like protein
MVWRLEERVLLPQISFRPQRWFTVDKATRNELRLRDVGSADGQALQPFSWIAHVHRSRNGYLARGGLARVLAWPYLFKHYSIRDLAEFLEIYGLPLRIGKYPVGAQADDKAVLARAVRDLGRNAAGIMPEDMQVELVAAAEGQADAFMAMVEYCDRAISKAVLGGTLSSTAGATGLGSGVAELQGEVRRDLLVSDARQLQGTLTRHLLWPLAALNGLGDDPRRGPRWVFDTSESEDLDAFSQSIERLVKAGMGPHMPVAWVRERAGIPEPAAGEATLAAPAPEPAPAAAALSAPASQSEPDYAEAQVAALARAAAAPMEALLAPIRAEIDAALAAGDDLATLGERLLTLYPRLPIRDLSAVLGEALSAAELAGRYDPTDDIAQGD